MEAGLNQCVCNDAHVGSFGIQCLFRRVRWLRIADVIEQATTRREEDGHG